jgi:hypothetical protein
MKAHFSMVKLLGYAGAAWSTLLCYAAMLLAAYYLGQKYYPMPYNHIKILSYLGTALFTYFIYLAIKSYFIFSFWTGIITGIIIFFLYTIGFIYFEGRHL